MYNNGLGKGEMPMFPNLLFKVKKGINFEPDSPNHDLLQLALSVSSTRLNPTYVFLDSTFNAPYGLNATYMGCRTRVLANMHGDEVSEGRGNIAFTTLNLPRVALNSKDVPEFFANLDKVLCLCEDSLMFRWNVVRKLRVRDIPFVFGEGIYMGSEDLGLDDTVESSLRNGSLGIGFIGLAQALVKITGKHHGESSEAQVLGLSIIQYIRDFADRLNVKHRMNWSVIGSPGEGLSNRFIDLDKKIYGIVPGVTDRGHYTNSSHVPVEYSISAEDKIRIEAPYHEMCNGGHIYYTELSGPALGNEEGLYDLIKAMSEANIGYAGINYHADFCKDCHLRGVIPDEGCPKCGSTSIRRVRRVSGYFSTTERIGSGKSDEIANRTVHAGRKVDA